MITSWATAHPKGFSKAEIAALQSLQPILGAAVKARVREEAAANVLGAYLGPDAGRRVLAGHIKLGDGERIRAVIWFSDLRGSSALADRLPGEKFLSLLNDYFHCTAGAVLDHGGEVLRFIGDAVLAIFPCPAGEKAEAAAARAALAAVTEAETRRQAKNADRSGAPALDFGIGLHVGEVMFGNIGVPERIEFTVVGPAANEAARLESLTKVLKRPILVSAGFADLLDRPWIPLGRHALRGVGRPMAVFAPSTSGPTSGKKRRPGKPGRRRRAS